MGFSKGDSMHYYVRSFIMAIAQKKKNQVQETLVFAYEILILNNDFYIAYFGKNFNLDTKVTIFCCALP